MTEKKQGLVIDYTSRDFDSIRSRLINHAKKYYPDTFTDFSSNSFGSMLIDMISYIGDQMSLYLDHSVNETFLPTARQYANILKLGEQMGYHYRPISSTTGIVELYLAIPPDSTGQVPDFRYAPVLKAGTTFMSDTGIDFTLVSDVNFSSKEVVTYTVIDEDPITGNPTLYGAQALGHVVSGRTVVETFQITDHVPFLSVQLNQANVTEVLSVMDSENREYYEVESLTQNVVYRQVSNGNNVNVENSPNMILLPMVVPRRFILEHTGENTILRFGHGSENESMSDSVVNPSDVVLKRHARNYISNFSFDPSVLIKNDKMGVAPSNTVLTVRYRANTSANASIPAQTINTVSRPDIKFSTSGFNLDESVMSNIRASLEVSNPLPFLGSATYPSAYELKHRIMSSYGAQNRAVTLQDYKSVVYNLPPEYSSFSRCYVERDEDSFKNNINIYLLSENSSGHLMAPSGLEKENLKTWLMHYKTVMDTVDLLDGKVVNIGIDFVVKIPPGKQESLVLSECYDAIQQEMGSYKLQFGQTIFRSNIYKALARVQDVVSVVDVSFRQIATAGYSDIYYDIPSKMLADGTGLAAEKDVCFEIKYPREDIRGAVER